MFDRSGADRSGELGTIDFIAVPPCSPLASWAATAVTTTGGRSPLRPGKRHPRRCGAEMERCRDEESQSSEGDWEILACEKGMLWDSLVVDVEVVGGVKL